MSKIILRYCKRCIEDEPDPKWRMLKAPGSAYCVEHRRAYQREYRRKRVAEQAALEEMYDLYGNPINEFGMTEEQMKELERKETARIERMYGPIPTDEGP